MDAKQRYDRFAGLLREIAHLGSVGTLCDWDQAVGMPKAAGDERADLIGWLGGLAHAKSTSDEYGTLLLALQTDSERGDLADEQRIEIRLAQEDFDRARRLPSALVERRLALHAQAYQVWERAKAASDWDLFLPIFRRVVMIEQETACQVGFTGSPYNVSLEEYDREMSVAKLDALLGRLRPALTGLVGRIAAAPGAAQFSTDAAAVNRTMSLTRQRRLVRVVAEGLGLDFTAARLDESAHPFTAGVHDRDVRVTMRYREDDFLDGALTMAHEAGHALYAQGLPATLPGMPSRGSPSYSLDEGIARLYENTVGRSRPFCDWLARIAPQRGRGGRELYRALGQVSPGPVRLEADEVTYGLFIIAAYEIERDLMEDRLEAGDVPEAWAQKMRAYLGIEVPDHGRGALQDDHWTAGFGYKPAYVVGDCCRAQLYAAALRDIPSLEDGHAHGDHRPLRQWLTEKVFLVGRRQGTEAIVAAATGEAPTERHLIGAFERKYGELYGL